MPPRIATAYCEACEREIDKYVPQSVTKADSIRIRCFTCRKTRVPDRVSGVVMTDGGVCEEGDEWAFQVGDVLKQSPTGVTLPEGGDVADTATEYTVVFRLHDADSESNKRYYQLEYQEGRKKKKYLASAKMVERDWARHAEADPQ